VKYKEIQLVTEGYFTVTQAASYLSMSERTVRSLLTDVVNPIPYFKKGRLIRIRRTELDRWIETYRAVNLFNIDEVVDDVLR
jgi:excisionase family DNA binding protein